MSVRPAGPPPLLPGPARAARPGGRAARADVGRRAVAPQGPGRVRKHAAGPAPAPDSAGASQADRDLIMASQPMPHRLERSVVIQRARATWSSATSPTARAGRAGGARARRSMPRSGGAVLIVHPGGVQVAGEILEIDPPARLVFTYGYVSGTPMPVGRLGGHAPARRRSRRARASTSRTSSPTRRCATRWCRAGATSSRCSANLVADDSNTGASTAVDGWFAAWSEPDAARREAMLDRLATEEVRFKDRFSLIDGLSDLRPHLAAVHRFMPGHAARTRGRRAPLPGHGARRLGGARAPTVRSAAAAPTSLPSATTAASRRSPVSGVHRRQA